MDSITQRFIAIGNRLLAELRSIGGSLTQIQQQIKAIAAKPQSEKKENGPPPEVIARLAFPAGIDTEKNASERRKQRRDRWRLFVEVLTLIAVVWYGAVAYHQWREMIIATGAAQQAVVEARLNRGQAEKSLDATIDQFRLEQRAWLGMGDVNARFIVGEPLLITTPIKNSGKTPALNVSVSAVLDAVPKDGKPDFSIPTPPSHRVVILPNAAFSAERNATHESGSLSQFGKESVMSGTQVLYNFGTVTYDDVFGYHHWFRFCYRFDPKTSGFPTCENHNDVDKEMR
jgi:hypothetical protein